MLEAAREANSEQVLCIGANWMHELPLHKKGQSILDEGSQRRLWSWLTLCDDSMKVQSSH